MHVTSKQFSLFPRSIFTVITRFANKFFFSWLFVLQTSAYPIRNVQSYRPDHPTLLSHSHHSPYQLRTLLSVSVLRTICYFRGTSVSFLLLYRSGPLQRSEHCSTALVHRQNRCGTTSTSTYHHMLPSHEYIRLMHPTTSNIPSIHQIIKLLVVQKPYGGPLVVCDLDIA
jgi:hypothetical protein